VERHLTVEQVVALVAAQFPTLAPVRATPVGAGWDNVAFRVNDTFVFRFPRREVAVALIDKERRVLPRLAPRLPLPIPVPVLFGAPCAAYPWPFFGYRALDGASACSAGLDDSAREALARPLAEFLAALHAIDAVDGAPRDTVGKLDRERLLGALPHLARVRGIDRRRLARVLEPEPACPPHANLVHGDLYSRHLLVDGAQQLCGIIDWGDVHVGDPAVDLAVAHGFLPPSAHHTFRRAYGEIDEARWVLARQRALFHSTMMVVYGDSIDDRELSREGVRALKRIAKAA
jgi:aminoglycoside phosphotransferase (APT) family kinase protein